MSYNAQIIEARLLEGGRAPPPPPPQGVAMAYRGECICILPIKALFIIKLK